MNFEQSHKRWSLAQDLRDAFTEEDLSGDTARLPTREVSEKTEYGFAQMRALLRMGPVSCGPVTFALSPSEKHVELHIIDTGWMGARAKLVVRWRKLLEKRGLESALEAIAGYNLMTFEIDLKHLSPTADGWWVAFEAVDGNGRTPSEALVQALKRWVLGAPSVEDKPQIKRTKQNGKRSTRGR